MSAQSPLIDTARKRHGEILRRTTRGPGDTANAMFRIADIYDLPYWKQWTLKYKGTATAEFIEQIRQAYLKLLAASVRRDLEALKIEYMKGGHTDAHLEDLITEAENLLAKIQEKRIAA